MRLRSSSTFFFFHLRFNPCQLKFLEFPCLNRAIGKLVVACSITTENTDSPREINAMDGRTGYAPLFRDVRHGNADCFCAPIRDIKENHCGVYEGVLRVQLRRKWANIVPVDVVLNFKRAVPSDPPRLLVHLFDRRSFRSGESFHLLHAFAEISNLVERIPRRHLHRYLTVHIRYGHRHVELVSLRMC